MCHLFPHVDKCCCCIPLRAGAFVVGWVYLIISVAMFLTSNMHLIQANNESQAAANCSWNCAHFTQAHMLDCTIRCYKDEMFKTDVQKYAGIWYFVVLLVLCVALLVGLAGHVPVLLLVFVYGIKVATLAYVAVVFRLLVWYEIMTEYIVLFAILSLIWWIPMIYSCIVVSSLYVKVMKTEDPPTGPPSYPV